MKRRQLLRALGGLATAGSAAGCLQDGPAGAPADGTDTATDSPTDTATDSPSPSPVATGELASSEFEVVGAGPGTRDHEASVEFGGGTATVDGTIPGANGCYTAELAGAAYDDGVLTVEVRSFEADPEGTATSACTQAIVAIDYRARFEFDGDGPTEVRVVHDAMGDRRVVTVAASESATTTATA